MKPNAAPPIPLNKAATGVIVPKLALSASERDAISTHNPSIRNAIAIRIPPPTTNGSICDTPFISCVYILWPAPDFCVVLSLSEFLTSDLYSGASPFKALSINLSALLIPSDT